VEFQILGPFRVVVANGRSLPLTSYKQRALLALLLLERNRPVSTDRLVDALWGERPPRSTANSVQVYVSRLRRTLASAGHDRALLTRPAGYVLRIDDEAVDAEQFDRLLAEGTEALRGGEAARAEAILARALGLWRGSPLSDFAHESFAQAEITRLEELYLRGTAARIEAAIALGRHAEMLSELRSLVAAHPLDEELRRHLMVALYRSGRPADALAVYRDLRGVLREELGLDPSPPLRDLERAVLRQNRELSSPVVTSSAQADALPGPTRRRDERKMVTVLIATLVGVADERADPEDISAFVAPYRRRLGEEVSRYGGTLVTAFGDSVAAVFGTPSAHDDDAERAVRAALAVRDWSNRTLGQMRIAVDTGEALVSFDVDAASAEPMLTGDVVSAVQRLQAVAPPSVVLVGSRAYGLSRDRIEFRAVTAEGTGGPAWEALRPRPADLAPDGRTPLVGRARELGVLVSAVDRVREAKATELVTIIGEPGIGKTRVVRELGLVLATELGNDISWWHGRSIPYGDGVAFWALAQVVKTQAGIFEADSSVAAAEKLARRVAALVGDREAEWVTRQLRPLLGLSDDGPITAERRDEAFAAWRRFFQAAAERRPLILVFEDIHWADEGLLDFIDSLVEWLTRVPLLVVATARPELLERRRPSEGTSERTTSLLLTALSDHETRVLLDHLLEPRRLPPQTRADLVAQVGGNPLYVEQYARLVKERPHANEVPVPDTVRATIAARLDALPVGEKRLLQSAAVFEKLFWVGAAAVVEGTDRLSSEASVHALERKQFVQRVPRSSVAGETEYTFRHVLLRDVAYDELPRAARVEKHRRAAAWIESLGRPDDHADLLAHHYVSALELRLASGGEVDDLAHRAYESLAKAGERAFALHAFDAAARHFERALELAPRDTSHPHVLFRYASALHLTVDTRAEEVLEDAREALVTADQGHVAAEVDTLLAEMWWHRAQRPRLKMHLARALEQLDLRTPKATRARVLEAVARFGSNAGEGQAAIRTAREALALVDELDSPELVANILVTLGMARWIVRDRGGITDVERGLELAIAAEAVTALPRAYVNLAVILARDGERMRGQELVRKSQEAAERLGDRNRVRVARAHTVINEFENGDWDAALSLADEFIRECDARARHFQEHLVCSVRASIYLGRGKVDAAVAEYELALERARGCDLAHGPLRQLAESGRAHAELGHLEQARALADEVLKCGNTLPAYWASNVISLALVAKPLGVTKGLLTLLGSREGDSFYERVVRHTLASEFDVAADIMAAGGDRTREAFLRQREGQSLIEHGRSVEAEQQLEKALSFYRAVRATRYVRETEAALTTARTVSEPNRRSASRFVRAG